MKLGKIALIFALGFASSSVISNSELYKSFKKAATVLKNETVGSVKKDSRSVKKTIKNFNRKYNLLETSSSINTKKTDITDEETATETKSSIRSEKDKIFRIEYSKGGNKSSFDY